MLEDLINVIPTSRGMNSGPALGSWPNPHVDTRPRSPLSVGIATIQLSPQDTIKGQNQSKPLWSTPPGGGGGGPEVHKEGNDASVCVCEWFVLIYMQN